MTLFSINQTDHVERPQEHFGNKRENSSSLKRSSALAFGARHNLAFFFRVNSRKEKQMI